ncbi:MAG: hypothetical protein U0838_18070 [Chloroflexota bacterium]
MTDALLFLHLLSAAALFAGVVAFSAVALGARLELGAVRAFLTLWYVGLVGVLLFGIALALAIDGYGLWDGWVLIALALWLCVGYPGDKLPAAYRDAGGGEAPLPDGVTRMHWISVAIVVLLLADMIWKPWA